MKDAGLIEVYGNLGYKITAPGYQMVDSLKISLPKNEK
jgi:hypothetical protein